MRLFISLPLFSFGFVIWSSCQQSSDFRRQLFPLLPSLSHHRVVRMRGNANLNQMEARWWYLHGKGSTVALPSPNDLLGEKDRLALLGDFDRRGFGRVKEEKSRLSRILSSFLLTTNLSSCPAVPSSVLDNEKESFEGDKERERIFDWELRSGASWRRKAERTRFFRTRRSFKRFYLLDIT